MHLEAEVTLKFSPLLSVSHSLPLPEATSSLWSELAARRLLFRIVPVQETSSFPGMLHHTPDICPELCSGTLKPALAAPATGRSPLLTLWKTNAGCFLYFVISPGLLHIMTSSVMGDYAGKRPGPRSSDFECCSLKLTVI